MDCEILFLEPVFTHNIWGGTKLRTDFGYDIEGNDIGECWGIAAHENGDCKVKNGSFEGVSLSQLWKEHPELFGYVKGERFPLLVKILDAKDDLSIQVHPNDAYAKENENGSYGKTECWYILNCEADASIIVGHNAKTKQELVKMVSNGCWNELIREIPVKKGDFIQLNPGLMHAIKGGIQILETQQNSDITYRVYDYDRLNNGKRRELHIEKSLDVIEVPSPDMEETIVHAASVEKNRLIELVTCPYYKVFKLEVEEQFRTEINKEFILMSVIEGSGNINGYTVKKGSHFIITNQCKKITMNGKMQVIVSTI